MKRVEVTDQWLYKYMPVVDEAIIQELENNIEECEFSDRFERKMRKLMWQEAHSWIGTFVKYAKRVAIIFGCIISSMLVVTMSVEAYRIKFFETLETIYRKAIVYTYTDEDEEAEFRILEPTYIPEGYHEYQEEIILGHSINYIYENEDKEWITWRQLMAHEGLTVGVDLEYDKEEKVEINGAIASVRTYDYGRCYIYYEYENYVILLSADNLSTEEAVKILESIQYKK